MNVAIYVVSALILFLLIILLSPIRLYAEVRKDEKGCAAKITAAFWFVKFSIFDTQKPQKHSLQTEDATEKDNPEKSLEDIKKLFEALLGVLRSLRKRFCVSNFSMDILIGTGDAASTGIITGSGYALIYNILGTIDRYFILKKQHVSVTPDFDRQCLYIDFKGSFSLKVIYALNTLTKILPILKSAD